MRSLLRPGDMLRECTLQSISSGFRALTLVDVRQRCRIHSGRSRLSSSAKAVEPGRKREAVPMSEQRRVQNKLPTLLPLRSRTRRMNKA